MPTMRRPRLTTGGRGNGAEMPPEQRPRLILVPLDHRIMPNTERANGKGQSSVAAMPACQSPFPTLLTGGHLKHAEMPPIMHPRLTSREPNFYAEMPRSPRSQFIWCRSTRAEMPLYWRTNNQRPLQKRRNVRYASPRIKQGDPLWINVTKTQPLPRYI